LRSLWSLWFSRWPQPPAKGRGPSRSPPKARYRAIRRLSERVLSWGHSSPSEQLKGPIEKLGYKVELVPFDDQAKPDVGVANAKNMVTDNDILAVVGHYNSGVAIPSSEIYKDAHLVEISPANTNPVVTDRNYAEVNRVCGRDDVQGVVGAEFAAKDMKVKSVYVIHDKTTYGQSIAEFFRDHAKKLGVQVMGFEGTEEKVELRPDPHADQGQEPGLDLLRRHLLAGRAAL